MFLLLFNHLNLSRHVCHEPTTVHPFHTKMARSHRFLNMYSNKNLIHKSTRFDCFYSLEACNGNTLEGKFVSGLQTFILVAL